MPNATEDILAIILGGGRGTRLYPLTKLRAKPAVPIAGKYRLIDVPISNCINSGIYRIAVLTQFHSVSLNRHITRTYRFDNFHGGWVQILAAEQTLQSEDWYQGTADAVRKGLTEIGITLEDRADGTIWRFPFSTGGWPWGGNGRWPWKRRGGPWSNWGASRRRKGSIRACCRKTARM